MIVKILIAVLIFGITVIIHELGHFLLAKANGITVTEFSIGFGPTVVKTEKGGTVYSLKLLPFGGACQMLGEDGEEEGEGTFNSKSVWARISVVVAGPVFNMILAFFCAIFVISYAGSSPARVTEVADGSPEAEAGLEAGDIITFYEGRHISIGKELNSVMTVQGVPTDEITLEVKKADGEKKTITYEPTVTTRYMMGFNYDDCDRGMEFTYVQQNMPLAALLQSHPLLLREEGSGSQRSADEFLRAAGLEPDALHVAARLNDQESIKNLVAAGLGLAIVSAVSVARERDRGDLLLFPLTDAARSFYIVTRRHDFLSPAARQFFDFSVRFYTE